MPSDQPDEPAVTVVRLVLTNSSSRSTSFALEPLGDVVDLPPGESATATYRADGPRPELNIVLRDEGVATWDESGTGLGLAPLRDGPGGDRWA